jgi:hypothetical protein
LEGKLEIFMQANGCLLEESELIEKVKCRLEA